MAYVLSIDIGTSACRAVLVSETGRLGAMVRQSIALSRQEPPFAEADCDAIWRRVGETVVRLIAEHPGAEVEAVGISAMLAYVMLDKADLPLGPAILYADNRASLEMKAILRTVQEQELHSRTGRRCAPELLAPKLLWVRANAPDLAARMHRVIGLKDEMVRRMTGIVSTDQTHVDYSMLYNVSKGDFDRELIKELGLDAHRLFPEPVPADHVVGRLCDEAAAYLGLKQGIPVVAGTSDGTAAMYGGGVHESDKAVLVAGSTDVLMMPAGAYPRDDSMTLTINSGLEEARFLAGGATGFSGASLQRFEALLNRSLASLEPKILDAPPGAEGLTVLPGLGGERAPYWREDILGAVKGLTLNHGPEHLFQALIEGICYRIRRLLKILDQAGLRARQVKVAGGSSANGILNRIRADVTGVPTVRLAEPQATCLGTAMFCRSALAGGGRVLAFSRGWVQEKETFEPQPEKTAAYDRLASGFEALIHNASNASMRV